MVFENQWLVASGQWPVMPRYLFLFWLTARPLREAFRAAAGGKLASKSFGNKILVFKLFRYMILAGLNFSGALFSIFCREVPGGWGGRIRHSLAGNVPKWESRVLVEVYYSVNRTIRSCPSSPLRLSQRLSYRRARQNARRIQSWQRRTAVIDDERSLSTSKHDRV